LHPTVITASRGTDLRGPLPRGGAGSVVVTAALHAAMEIHADVLHICFVEVDSILHSALKPLPQSWLLQVVPNRLRELPGYPMRLRKSLHW